MRSDDTTASDLLECGGVSGRAIVAEIRDRKRGSVLDGSVHAKPLAGRERIVGAVDRRRDRERRELLISAQGLERRLVADAVVDAEVHIASIDLADLEAIVGADRRSVSDFTGEGDARSVTAIDVDARCAAAVGKEAQCQFVVRGQEPRLSEIDAGVVCRNEVSSEIAGLRNRSISEDAASVERAGQDVPDRCLDIDPPRAAHEVVVSETSFELDKIDSIESGAHACFPRRRLLEGYDNHLRRIGCRDVDRRTRLDGSPPEKIRLVERALAAEHLGADEKVADVESQRFFDGAFAHALVARDHDVFHRGLVFRVER